MDSESSGCPKTPCPYLDIKLVLHNAKYSRGALSRLLGRNPCLQGLTVIFTLQLTVFPTVHSLEVT